MPRSTEKVSSKKEKKENQKKFAQIDEKIVKLDKKMDSTRSAIEKLEAKLEKQKQRKLKRINEKLQIRKVEKRKRRQNFFDNFSVRRGAIITFDAWLGSSSSILDEKEEDDHFSPLPVDMLALIASYMGSMELTMLFSVSHALNRKLVISFQSLYKNLYVNMDSFVPKEKKSAFAKDIIALDEHVSELEKAFIKRNESSQYLITRCTMIRIILRLQCHSYQKNRCMLSFTNDSSNGFRKTDSINPVYAFYENFHTNSSSSAERFLPLTNGMFLAMSSVKNLPRVHDRIFQSDRQLYSNVLNDSLSHFMDHSDCLEMELTNLSSKQKERRSFSSLRSTKTNVRRFVYFDSNLVLNQLNPHSLFGLCFSKYDNLDKYPLRFIDYTEMRFSANNRGDTRYYGSAYNDMIAKLESEFDKNLASLEL